MNVPLEKVVAVSIFRRTMMNEESNFALDALNLAIQMEIDGREFYLQQARATKNAAGRSLFEALAREELDHRARFESVFKSLSEHGDWPHGAIQASQKGAVETLFRDEALKIDTHSKGTASEISAAQKSIEMENASYELYQQRQKDAASELERDFYRELAGEERGHYLALLDYTEFLSDPDNWFTTQEHHSLDGG